MKENRGTKMAVVALSAAAVGAGVALLTAPRSGKETRSQIKDKAARLKLKAQQTSNEMRQQMQQRAARAKEVRKRFIQSFKDTKAELADEAAANKEHIKSSMMNRWHEEV